MRIQHNIAALNAYRNLTGNNTAVSKNLEKLSSGYRINRAGDDAAGLAISEKMRAQITGLETAQKNANDGISLVQTAEGALTEVHSMLNRMVELASQSANGTYADDVDRENMQAEITQLKEEIDRISQSTNYNGIKLLDGSLGVTKATGAQVSGVNLKTLSTGASTNAVDGGKALFTIVNDAKLAAEPTKGKYVLNLSQLVITNTQVGKTAQNIGAGQIKITVGGDSGITITNISEIAYGGGDGSKLTGAQLAKEWVAKQVKDHDGEVTLNNTTFLVSEDGKGNITFEMKDIPATEFTANMTATLANSSATLAGKATTNIGDSFGVKVETEPVANGSRVYAHAQVTLTSSIVRDGGALKIGDTTYVFAVGKDSKWKGAPNVIDLTDQAIGSDGKTIAKDVLTVAAQRLTQVAKENAQFDISTHNNDNVIELLEKEGGIDYTKNDLQGETIKKYKTGEADSNTSTHWKGLVQVGDARVVEAKAREGGLTLQIGDTAEEFNQLNVGVDDMSSKSLGIGDVDISTLSGAQAAIDKIKDAINKVSSTRGDLGAIQNRLEHTINNLSVTSENMTAAESRIRDVDMAEEMMAYTKNNILVQAAQAMLAQANQIPQGVLQLLQ